MPELVYNKERGTWNVFIGAEWYAEGNYEEMDDLCRSIRLSEIENECSEPESDYYGD